MSSSVGDSDSDDDWFTKDPDEHVASIKTLTITATLPNSTSPVTDGHDDNITQQPTRGIPSHFTANDDDSSYAITSAPKRPSNHAVPTIHPKKLSHLLDLPLCPSLLLELLPTHSGFIETIANESALNVSCVHTLVQLLANVSAGIGAFPVHTQAAFLPRLLATSAFWSRIERTDKRLQQPAHVSHAVAFMRNLCTFARNTISSVHCGELLDHLLPHLIAIGSALHSVPAVRAAHHKAADELADIVKWLQQEQAIEPVSRDLFADVLEQLFGDDADLMTATPEPNVTSGPYAGGFPHYLRTHLQLIRSDVWTALRLGVQQLRCSSRETAALESNSSFWVYVDKQIVRQPVHRTETSTSIGFVVRLSADELRAVAGNTDVVGGADDEGSTSTCMPFMAGSLLLFATSVDRDDVLLMATVVELNVKQGWVQIQPLHIFNSSLCFLDQPLLMLESKIYFDPPHQVYRRLSALTVQRMPFAEQLILASSHPTAPVYLTAHQRPPTIAATLGCNAGQVAAIEHALHHRVALVQGPPGTGKSFVGLRLAQHLLSGTEHRIVVLCRTNQALDQFLAALVAVVPPTLATECIVRMGDQCTSAALRPFCNRTQTDGVRTDNGLIQKHLFLAHQALSKCTEGIATLAMRVSTEEDADATTAVGRLQAVLAEAVAARGRLNELRQLADYERIKGRRVVGMTSSFAARNGTLVELLKAPIVIVEEAAELLEAHVVASLTPHTQHLIMIGDHQQLRPATCSPPLAARTALNVSLFERLHRHNRLPSVCLSEQHRMRPAIADLLRPSPYALLRDAPNVVEMEPVRGMPGPVYFVDHRCAEQRRSAGTTSSCNVGEAQLVRGLCAYLLQQGYAPADITVLCTYRAQIGQLERANGVGVRGSGRCHGCRIACIDGFQGRESRIVLLSLVRNNAAGSVGFVAEAERACVALSRAREGLFVFGQLQHLALKNDVWANVRARLSGGGIGDGELVVRCERHGNETRIRSPNDFGRVADGGCGDVCGAPLANDVLCGRRCHGAGIGHSQLGV